MFQQLKTNNGRPPVTKADELVYQVYRTYDYSKFKIIQGNRILDINHIKRLRASFEEQHLVSITICNEYLEVIDGQNRLQAAKETGKPVYYIIVPGYSLTEVQRYNSNNSTWKKKDHLESYCQLGLKPYLQFKQFMKDFPDLPMIVCGQLLTDRHNLNVASTLADGKKSFQTKDFEEGTFQIKDLDKAYVNAKKIMEFKKYYKGFSRKSFVAAMITVFKNKNYDHAEMMKKLSKSPVQLVHMANVGGYIQLLEEIYNHRRQTKVSLKYNA